MRKIEGPAWDYLRSLQLSPCDYAIFGSGPLFVFELIDEINDIDIVARGKAWKRASSFSQILDSKAGGKKIALMDGKIEIFNSWMGIDVDLVIDNALVIDGLSFATLQDVLGFKKFLMRPKDSNHIRIIEKYLRKGSK